MSKGTHCKCNRIVPCVFANLSEKKHFRHLPFTKLYYCLITDQCTICPLYFYLDGRTFLSRVVNITREVAPLNYFSLHKWKIEKKRCIFRSKPLLPALINNYKTGKKYCHKKNYLTFYHFTCLLYNDHPLSIQKVRIWVAW